MNDICQQCGNGHYAIQDNLQEVIFPIGEMTTGMPCEICNSCGHIKFNKDFLGSRKSKFEFLKNQLLIKNRLDFIHHPDLYVDEMEFQKITGIKITNDNRHWFSCGLFSFWDKEKLLLLRKSVDLYLKTDDGMFWLVNEKNLDMAKMHDGCPWCTIGQLIQLPDGNFKCENCGMQTK